jgi:hypothetical protein
MVAQQQQLEKLQAERDRQTDELDRLVSAFAIEQRRLSEQEEDIESSLGRLEREIASLTDQQAAVKSQRQALVRLQDETAAALERSLKTIADRHFSMAASKIDLNCQPPTDMYNKPCVCSCACACPNVFLCACARACFCVTHRVWFMLTLGGKLLPGVEMSLLGRTAPRTVENFYRRVVQKSYRGTPINWIKKNGWMAGGQLRSAEDGRPLPSIFGGDLERETPRLRHYGPGWVHSWSNTGKENIEYNPKIYAVFNFPAIGLQGQCHDEMNNFSGPKNQISSFCISAVGYYFFAS